MGGKSKSSADQTTELRDNRAAADTGSNANTGENNINQSELTTTTTTVDRGGVIATQFIDGGTVQLANDVASSSLATVDNSLNALASTSQFAINAIADSTDKAFDFSSDVADDAFLFSANTNSQANDVVKRALDVTQNANSEIQNTVIDTSNRAFELATNVSRSELSEAITPVIKIGAVLGGGYLLIKAWKG